MFQNNLLMGAAAATSGGGASVVSVGNSALFDSANSEYLSRTPIAAGNRDTWTFSHWVYKTYTTGAKQFFGAGANNTNNTELRDQGTGKLEYRHQDGGAVTDSIVTTPIFRDIGWYHIVWAVDTTQVITSDRVIIYVNGKRVTSFSTANYPAQNADTDVNAAVATNIGARTGPDTFWSGYMAETVLIDGLQLSPTSFGEYDSSGLFWTPLSSDTIKELTFGTNGFYLANDQGGAQFDSRYSNPTTYVPNSVNFDGTNDTLQRGADLTGNADTKNAIISFWIRRNGGAGSKQTILNNLNGLLETYIGADNKVHLEATGGGSKRCDINTTATILVDGSWHHVMMSFNGTSQHVYVDGVSSKTSTTNVDATIDWTMDNWYMGASQTPSYYLNADVADLIFDNTYLDLSQSSNRALFINTDGDPVDPGSDGSTAIVAGSPLIVFNKALASWHTNAGTGEGFTEVGALTAGSTVRSAFANDFINNNTVTTNLHSPTNSHPVQNALTITNSYPSTLANGNLKQTGNAGGSFASGTLATLPCDGGGKFYWEIKVLGTYTTNGYSSIGVAPMDLPRFDHVDGNGNFCLPGQQDYQGVSTTFNTGTTTNLRANSLGVNSNIGSAYAVSTGAFMQIAFDSATQKVWFGKDNTWYNSGDPANGTNPTVTLTATDKTWFPWIGTYTASDIFQLNYGATAFEYTPPTGFEKVNTTQLASDITRTASDTTKYFDTILYEGNGTGQRVGQFQPFTNSFTVGNGALFPTSNGNLSKTFGSAGNQKKWTFSAWLKKCVNGAYLNVLRTSHGNDTALQFTDADKLQFYLYDGSYLTNLITTAVYKDSSQWMHVVVKWDSTPSTPSASSVAIYINGSQVTALDTAVYPSQNVDSGWNGDGAQNIGFEVDTLDWNGYMSEVTFIDGSALEPSSFGQTDTSTNRWIPKAVTGLTFGSNGFYLDFADSGNVGDDESGNANDWTNNNSVAQVADSPTTNANVWNPAESSFSGGTFSNGNRTVVTGSSQISPVQAGIPISSGKWYCEVVPQSSEASFLIGLTRGLTTATNQYLGQLANDVAYYGNGNLYMNGAGAASYGASYDQNDVIGMAIDLDNNTLTYYKNGSSQGVINLPSPPSANSFGWYDTAIYRNNGSVYASYFDASPTNSQVQSIALDLDSIPQTITFRKANTAGAAIPIPPNKVWHPTLRNGAAADASNVTLNFGASDFTYTPPTGFVGLKQDNIASSDQFISAFSWIKNRDTSDNYMLFDRVRGPFKDLHSNDTPAEVTNVETVQQFLAGGVQVGNDVEVNTASESYVLWNWMIEATGTGSSNEDGTINTTSTLVDTTLGLSVSKYTGTGSNATVGHGLGVAPNMMLIKNLGTTDNWSVYYGDNTDYIVLNTAAGTVDDATMWNDTSPTSSVFSIGSNHQVNASSETYIAYCFANSQFISVGTFTGNENANGTFVPTVNSLSIPIQPSFVLIKNSVQSRSWVVWDKVRSPFNVSQNILEWDFAQAEQTGSTYYLDIVTGGFKPRGTHEMLNGAETMIYLAIGTPLIDTDGRIIAGR